MRSAADNFTVPEIYRAAERVHSLGKKLYLTVNTMPRTDEYPALRQFLSDVKGAGIDAMIVADMGVISLIKQMLPDMEIHISTQASIISPEAALAWASLGAKRLVLARELTLSEIRTIRAALPREVELEAFVHGSMCVSYSGRCLLANEMNGRDGNRGTCSQPCRWNYVLYEEKRPEMPIPIEQTEVGTFILSSKDMCTIGIIPELMTSGIDSFKIEGRMKSAYYTAVVTNTYRMAMDAYTRAPEHYVFDPRWMDELESVSHREYATGFYLDHPMENPQLVSTCGYLREKAYFAAATEYTDADASCLTVPVCNENGTLYRFVQRNKVSVGDPAEIISPGCVGKPFTVTELYDGEGMPIDSAPHPSMPFWCRVPFPVSAGDILRAGEAQGFVPRAPEPAKN